MPILQGQSLRLLTTACVLCILTISILLLSRDSDNAGKYIIKSPTKYPPPQSQECPPSKEEHWEFDPARDANNHGLSEEQCRIAFPKLFVEIEKSADERTNGSISYEEVDSVEIEDGMVRAVVFNGELYIIEYGDMPYTGTRAKSTLYSLNRALTSFANKESLPNIEFIFTADDFASDTTAPIWSYSKRDGDTSIWLIPDFGYWSWPEVGIGSYGEIRSRIRAIDDEIPFQEKRKQLLWRGSVVSNPEIRSKLIKTAVGQSWASIKVIDWDDENDIRFNLLPMEDHCKYMFLAHTEGRSFSGRGKYLLNCRSVVVSHKLEWKEAHHAALISSGPEANYVQVERDYSDLSRKIEFLIDHPETTERIAENAVKTFRDRYLTPAAEACYWRELVRKYASASGFEPVLGEDGEEDQRGGRKKVRGTKFDDWVLTGLK